MSISPLRTTGSGANGSAPSTTASEILPLVYADLRRLAAGYLRHERWDHTLQPTALVHEAFLRLSEMDQIDLPGRAQFFALAARQIRNVLIDHARRRGAQKRGSGLRPIDLDSVVDLPISSSEEWLDLDEALTELAVRSVRQARIVEMKFFAGMSLVEIGEALEVSVSTVKADWRTARAWLCQFMARAGRGNG